MYRARVGLDAQKPGIARDIHKAKFRQCHEKKLQEIRSRAPGTGTLDNLPPYTSDLEHLKTRPKKKAILAARDAEVERGNRELLRQMTKIFMTPSALLPIYDTPEGGDSADEGLMVCASINATERKRELQRIAMENKHLVKHLDAVAPSYDVASWERDRVESRKLLKRLRTVRYERRRRAPEEFSRRGVRHLRRQVERTRGQAFEAGSATIPRLDEYRRRKRSLGEKGVQRRRRATDRCANGQRFVDNERKHGNGRMPRDSWTRTRSESSLPKGQGALAGTAAGAQVEVGTAEDGERSKGSPARENFSDSDGREDSASKEKHSTTRDSFRMERGAGILPESAGCDDSVAAGQVSQPSDVRASREEGDQTLAMSENVPARPKGENVVRDAGRGRMGTARGHSKEEEEDRYSSDEDQASGEKNGDVYNEDGGDDIQAGGELTGGGYASNFEGEGEDSKSQDSDRKLPKAAAYKGGKILASVDGATVAISEANNSEKTSLDSTDKNANTNRKSDEAIERDCREGSKDRSDEILESNSAEGLSLIFAECSEEISEGCHEELDLSHSAMADRGTGSMAAVEPASEKLPGPNECSSDPGKDGEEGTESFEKPQERCADDRPEKSHVPFENFLLTDSQSRGDEGTPAPMENNESALLGSNNSDREEISGKKSGDIFPAGDHAEILNAEPDERSTANNSVAEYFQDTLEYENVDLAHNGREKNTAATTPVKNAESEASGPLEEIEGRHSEGNSKSIRDDDGEQSAEYSKDTPEVESGNKLVDTTEMGTHQLSSADRLNEANSLENIVEIDSDNMVARRAVEPSQDAPSPQDADLVTPETSPRKIEKISEEGNVIQNSCEAEVRGESEVHQDRLTRSVGRAPPEVGELQEHSLDGFDQKDRGQRFAERFAEHAEKQPGRGSPTTGEGDGCALKATPTFSEPGPEDLKSDDQNERPEERSAGYSLQPSEKQIEQARRDSDLPSIPAVAVTQNESPPENAKERVVRKESEKQLAKHAGETAGECSSEPRSTGDPKLKAEADVSDIPADACAVDCGFLPNNHPVDGNSSNTEAEPENQTVILPPENRSYSSDLQGEEGEISKRAEGRPEVDVNLSDNNTEERLLSPEHLPVATDASGAFVPEVQATSSLATSIAGRGASIVASEEKCQRGLETDGGSSSQTCNEGSKTDDINVPCNSPPTESLPENREWEEALPEERPTESHAEDSHRISEERFETTTMGTPTPDNIVPLAVAKQAVSVPTEGQPTDKMTDIRQTGEPTESRHTDKQTESPPTEPTESPLTENQPTDEPTERPPTETPHMDEHTECPSAETRPTDEPTESTQTETRPTHEPTESTQTETRPTDEPTESTQTKNRPTDEPTKSPPAETRSTHEPTESSQMASRHADEPTENPRREIRSNDEPMETTPTETRPMDAPTENPWTDEPTEILPTESRPTNEVTESRPTDEREEGESTGVANHNPTLVAESPSNDPVSDGVAKQTTDADGMPGSTAPNHEELVAAATFQ